MNKTGRRQLAATVYSDHPHNRLDTVKEWLNANYVVKVNLLDRSKVSLEPTEECTFRYEYPVTENDILLHAFAEEIKISEKNLRMLLASPNQMHSFNPIKDYLESLRGKYEGPSQIDMLCESLHQTDENKEFRARTSRSVRKYVRTMWHWGWLATRLVSVRHLSLKCWYRLA